jgi:DNA-binding CsgD family transcriptional regulator
MKGSILLILFLSVFVAPVLSQNGILIPEIINYSKRAYESGNQNRVIAQDKRGLLYFANDDGLLVFDGTYWKTYPLPNKSIVRSLAVMDDKIYIGGQQDIGYFSFDAQGVLSYRSLKPLIPPGQTDFSDVWRVIPFQGDVFFQSNKRIFQWHNGKVLPFKSINWAFMGVARGMLIAQEYEHGLMTFRNGQWLPFPGEDALEFAKDRVGIRGFVNIGAHKLLIATLKSGLYICEDGKITPFAGGSVARVTADLVQSVFAIDTAYLAIGTRLGGYYVIDSSGAIIQHATKQEGLQSNTVNSVFADKEKNIWLGLNNGIDMVIFNSPVNHITPVHDTKSPGYSAAIYHDHLYIGTGLGLYSVPVGPDEDLSHMQKDFTLVKNSNGLVWGLSVVNDQLFMGRSDGAYLVKDDNCIALDTTTGFWSFQPLTAGKPSPRIIGGTYNGMNVYNFANGQLNNPHIHTFFESAKNIVVMGSEIWVAHAYQGLYRINFNQDGIPITKPYNDIHHLLTGHNHLFKIQGKMILVTRNGIFEYDKEADDFKESEFFKKIFGDSFISYLREDTRGNIWFIGDKKPGVIDLSQPDKPVVIHFSELNNSVIGNDDEYIYPINNNNVLISGEIGFYHINYEKYKTIGHSLKVLLRNVMVQHERDSVIFGGYLKGDSTNNDLYKISRRISYAWNSMRFEFSSPYYSGAVEYSSRLKGYEKEWTPWSKRTERSYTNLPAGDYVFEVRAMNSTGHQSSVSSVVFAISPPWYKTYLAYALYLALTVFVLYVFYKRQQKKYLIQHANRLRKQRETFNEEQRRLQYQHQLELEKNEKEIIRLKNIKLEAEVEHNNAVLASNTMNLLQKRELLNKIKDEILKVQEEIEPDRRTKNIRRIIKIINEQLDTIDDWEQFSEYFDKSNNDFLRKLKENYPGLTAADLKLCAYLRLNLSTKAIADLLNLSIRGVESSRYRLRKKLLLDNEMSLFDFVGQY